MKVGVLALQGDYREHIVAVTSLGVLAAPVKTSAEINEIDALIIPGGESTTIS
jgi:5'-phosphate synthase pdxT subunit